MGSVKGGTPKFATYVEIFAIYCFCGYALGNGTLQRERLHRHGVLRHGKEPGTVFEGWEHACAIGLERGCTVVEFWAGAYAQGPDEKNGGIRPWKSAELGAKTIGGDRF